MGKEGKIEKSKEEKLDMSFNSEKDISKQDWEEMKNTLEESRTNKDWRDFSIQATYMKILNPEINLDLTDEEWEGMKDLLGKYRKNEDWWRFPRQAVFMKTLNPEMNLDLTDEEWEGMRKKLKEILFKSREQVHGETRYLPSSVEAFIQATRMKILNPKINLDLSGSYWMGIKKELEDARKNKDWDSFLMKVVPVKVLEPNSKISGLDNRPIADLETLGPEEYFNLNLTDEEWDEMREELEKERKNKNWMQFSQDAMYMKILAADKVEVNENGLKIE